MIKKCKKSPKIWQNNSVSKTLTFPFKGCRKLNIKGIAKQKFAFFLAFIRFHTQINSSGYLILSGKNGGVKLGGGSIRDFTVHVFPVFLHLNALTSRLLA